MFGYGCLLPIDSVGLCFFFVFAHLTRASKCTQVCAYLMIGTGMCLGIGGVDLGWKIFHDRCLGMGAYSLGIVWDWFFFASAHLIRASKVYISICMVHDRYWYVSVDRLH